jgi:hypothetical protein
MMTLRKSEQMPKCETSPSATDRGERGEAAGDATTSTILNRVDPVTLLRTEFANALIT